MRRRLGLAVALTLLACSIATALAAAAARDWAAPQIKLVTDAGVLGSSPATFAPQSALTQGALATAIKNADALQHPPVAAPKPPKLTLLSTLAPNSTIGGVVTWAVQAPGQTVDHVDYAIDGVGVSGPLDPAGQHLLDTRALADGTHQLAVNVAFAGGGYAIATLAVTVANAPGSLLSPPTSPVQLTIAKSSVPAGAAAPAAAARTLYSAVAPASPVSLKALDAALVGYLELGDAARKIQSTLEQAGLHPPANTGTEAVARMLGLRLNHPASDDGLELLPYQPATRAEAAYSFAQVLHLDDSALESVQQAADSFTLPAFTPWQQKLLTTAVSYVGYPYIWGGTSPRAETLFGVHSAGGFDCSGFVWRVVKLTPYTGEGRLASVLRGRTTYQMSGEVPAAGRLPAAKLQPADVMFFGAHGPASKPSEVDHTGLYLGNGWFVQSSGEGVTLLPFDGWYTHSFAWARRPLREAGLS